MKREIKRELEREGDREIEREIERKGKAKQDHYVIPRSSHQRPNPKSIMLNVRKKMIE